MTTFLQTHNEQEARQYLYNTTINIGAGSSLVLPKTSLKSTPTKKQNSFATNFGKEKKQKQIGFVNAFDRIKKTNNKQTNKPRNNKTKHTFQNHTLKAQSFEKRDHSKSFGHSGKKNSKSNLYKTEVCRSWIENGYCKYGNKCQFAHGTSELRKVSRHPKYKTQICKSYNTQGICNYGRRCKFIHKKVQPVTNQSKTICKRLSFFQTICNKN